MINISKLYCGLAGESDELRYQQSDSFGPVVVYNCTEKCNLKCLHCYSSAVAPFGGPVDSSAGNQLTTVQAERLLSQLAEANCPVLLFSGGEPLLRGDLFELLAEARRLALRAVISSNGTLIDSPTAKKLADLGVNYVGISIDGREKFHDEFRQVKGCFKAAVAGIENCRKAGIKTGIRFTITTANAGQVPFVFDIAASTGVRRICFYHLIRMGRAKALYSPCVMRPAPAEASAETSDASREKNTQYAIRNKQYVMTPQQTRQALDIIIERTGDFARRGLIDEVLTVGNHADGPYLLVRMQKDNRQTFQKARELLLANGGNKVGEKIGCVSWNGDVYADQFWRNYSLGNIKDRTFKEIWEDSTEPVLNRLRNKSEFADTRCLHCKWFDLCKGNFRFLGTDADDEYWLNEPACYLTDEEIENSKCKNQNAK